MKSSIYISSEKIEVIGYTKSGRTVTVKDYITHLLFEECVINGKIVDAAPILEGLNVLKSKKPDLFTDISLIIDGSFIFTKKIAVPEKLKKKQYDQVIRDEFTEVAGDHENLICDYHMLETADDQSRTLLAFAIEREHLENHLDILGSAGIKPSAIRIGLLAILQYISGNSELNHMTFVLNVVDGVTMLSMIFQNGVNTFLSRRRLYGEDNDGLVRNTLEGLSGFIQFNKSQNFNDITHCFYLGVNEEDMELIRRHSSYGDIEFGLLDIYKGAKGIELLPAEAHFAYMNTLFADSANDLIRGSKELDKAKKKSRPRKWWLLILVCVLVLLAIPTGYLAKQVSDVGKEIDSINDYLTVTNIAVRSAELDIIMTETTRIREIIRHIENKLEADRLLPCVTVPLMDAIVVRDDTRTVITNFEFKEADGTVRITGSSPTENDAAHFVETLKANDLIDDIYYTGYNYSTLGRYNFTANIKVHTDKEGGE